MTFQALGLIAPLLQTLDTLGYRQPTPVQQQAIPAVLAGRDLMAAAQTGTGKTAGFALPILQQLLLAGENAPGAARCLVLAPTRELAEQVFESFRTYGARLPLRAAVAYGGVPIAPQIARLRKGVDVLVATPGRLIDLLDQGAVSFAQLQTLVLDEADRMLDLGFERDLDILLAALPRQRQTLLFSATFSDRVRQLTRGMLKDPVSVQVETSNASARTVRQWLIPTDKRRKPELLLHLLDKFGWRQVLVFVKTRKGAEQLVKTLHAHGITADTIHGDKTQPARLKALARFKKAEVQLLVATDVAARGLDIEALPQVVNFDLPSVAEDYIHRIGRTGRAGLDGEAISLVCADEADMLKAIETLTRQVIARFEEPGFEADHRVPETAPAAAAAAAAKKAAAAAPGKKKRPFTGPAGGKAARAPAGSPAGGQKPVSTSTGKAGAPGANARTAAGSGTPAPRHPSAPAQAGTKPGARSAARSAAPQGAIVVTAGRGAKSLARAAGKVTAQAGNRKTRSGPRS
ncbi:DEAD/DEAH box helicase [Duganella sp. Leaf126]|uniref:DEAD/DEAH box helicase n=1 Tax=Duganella sp. Leaf126 TaxID=1736266 RepID=UPI0006FE9E93|nr:DEAD/DEAH box helicase [Duganella sp. Leaf126]KQQ40545.1 DEAD/DEAH box helicase [Duganella sp. Leaf126]